MPVQHMWSGILHYLDNARSLFPPEAMNRAFAAYWLFCSKGTNGNTLHDVLKEFPTIFTKITL